MGTSRNFGYFIAGVAAGFLAGWFAKEYAGRQHDASGLLRGCAHFLRNYQDNRPEEALKQTMVVLDMVGKDTKDYESLLDVVEECLCVGCDVRRTQLHKVYHPALISLAERIEALV